MEEKETGRIEAFSDGVFAIAITLLILEVRVPRVHDLAEEASLLRALVELWPAYLAFLTSFVTILIMWINHHRLFRLIKRCDHVFLLLNGLLLLAVTFVPFPTALLAEYVRHPDGRVAAAVYSGAFVFTAIVFNLLWRYASSGGRLLDPNYDPEVVRAITRQYLVGPVVYGVALGLAALHPMAAFAMCVALAVYFALPPRGPRS